MKGKDELRDIYVKTLLSRWVYITVLISISLELSKINTSLHRQTMDMGLVQCACACLMSQLLPVLTMPTRGGMARLSSSGN